MSKQFEFNLSLEELRMRTDKEHLVTKNLLTCDSKEFKLLETSDKLTLAHLVKAANILEKIEYQLDNPHNLEVLKWLENQDNEQAKLTLKLFNAQKGINAIDGLANKISLIKDLPEKINRGYYPEDLTIEEFHNVLFKMLSENKIEEVRKILSQRTVVVRDNNELKGIDYVDYFKDDFMNMALELEYASLFSTNSDFKDYLLKQSKAFKIADDKLDAEADIKWATLQDTPLEFTITRENYKDEFTASIMDNKELMDLLEKNNITPLLKDSLGCRVGIINKEGTDTILKVKEYLPIVANAMPYLDKYTNTVNSDDKQTMVDVDLVAVTGDVGAYRAGITLAENLPNDDKLALKLGGGRRNVYHRQIRFISNYEKLQKFLDVALDKSQHKYYYDEASHWATMWHENGHSLGPNKNQEKLGKYSQIIEENKADMVSLAFLDLLVEKGLYTKEERDKIIVTEVMNLFLKAKPELNQAHRVRTVMQNKYFFDNGGYSITSEGKVLVNIDKIPQIAKSMLDLIIEIQLSEDINRAEEYVNKYFVWTKEMEDIANNIKDIDKTLNGSLNTELADNIVSYIPETRGF